MIKRILDEFLPMILWMILLIGGIVLDQKVSAYSFNGVDFMLVIVLIAGFIPSRKSCSEIKGYFKNKWEEYREIYKSLPES